MPPGRLITIEGIDGAGKSTLAEALLGALRERRITIELLREPGGVAASERIRELVKDPGLSLGSQAEALLYAAARAQLLEEAVEPALAAGRWVLLDRFVDSSLAYQGGGRELGIAAVREINRFATRGRVPDRTLLLLLPPEAGRARALGRGEPPDRLERERHDFYGRIDQAYRRLAAEEPERIRTLDATGTPEEVLTGALQALADLL